MSTTSPGAATPASRPTHVHHIQARKAFGPDGGAYVGRLVAYENSTALVERVPRGPVDTFVVARADDFATTLTRDDLTQLDGAPLVLVNATYNVLGIATGPATPPERLSLILVTRLEGGHAVEIPAADPEQPNWQLFVIWLAEPTGDGNGPRREQ
jgi:hypothetical protein